VNHYHGITLCDAQDCTIEDNACFSRWSDRARPWLQLGQKKKQARGNFVRNNLAHSFDFKADADVKTENNLMVTQEEFYQRQARLLTLMEDKFGKLHPVAKRLRLEPVGTK